MKLSNFHCLGRKHAQKGKITQLVEGKVRFKSGTVEKEPPTSLTNS